MKSVKVASRYAKSLLQLALEKGQLEDAYLDMQFIASACNESKELRLLLGSPVVKTDKKDAILQQLFGQQLGAITMAFVQIITRKKREGLLHEIARSFISQYKTHKRIITAEVTTAMPLDESLRQRVLNIVKTLNYADIDLVEKVDADIVGGIVLRVGDHQVDASVKRKLRELRRELTDSSYVADF